MQNSPYSFQKFKKIPLFFAVIFLGASSYTFFFLYQQIDNSKILSEQMQQEWQLEALKRSQIQSLDRLINSTEAERILLDSHFAKSSNVVPLLDTIQKLATAVGAQSEVVSVDLSKDKTGGLVFGVKATGSFGAVYKFLTLLENSPYELDFISVDIKNTTPQSIVDKKVTASEWEGDFRIKLLSFIQ